MHGDGRQSCETVLLCHLSSCHCPEPLSAQPGFRSRLSGDTQLVFGDDLLEDGRSQRRASSQVCDQPKCGHGSLPASLCFAAPPGDVLPAPGHPFPQPRSRVCAAMWGIGSGT